MPKMASRVISIGPGSRLAGRLVGSMKVDDQVMLGGVFEQSLIEIDNFLGLVIEEIDLYPGDTGAATAIEEFLAGLRRMQAAAVVPDDDADTALAELIDQLAQVARRASVPETFDDVVLEAQVAGQP